MSIWLIMLLVWAIIIAFLLLVPSMTWLRRIMGYMLLTDISVSAYIISVYATTGAVSGLTIAIFAALGVSLSLRGLRAIFGYEKLSINGNESLRLVAADLLTQGVSWGRAIVAASWRGGRVDAPEPLQVTWVQHAPSLFTWLARAMSYVRSTVPEQVVV